MCKNIIFCAFLSFFWTHVCILCVLIKFFFSLIIWPKGLIKIWSLLEFVLFREVTNTFYACVVDFCNNTSKEMCRNYILVRLIFFTVYGLMGTFCVFNHFFLWNKCKNMLKTLIFMTFFVVPELMMHFFWVLIII